jgi:hypothetical protein
MKYTPNWKNEHNLRNLIIKRKYLNVQLVVNTLLFEILLHTENGHHFTGIYFNLQRPILDMGVYLNFIVRFV